MEGQTLAGRYCEDRMEVDETDDALRMNMPFRPGLFLPVFKNDCPKSAAVPSRTGHVRKSLPPPLQHYWPIALAVEENTLLAFEPIKRTVPTTRTRITASNTAYSAISWPFSLDQSWRKTCAISTPPLNRRNNMIDILLYPGYWAIELATLENTLLAFAPIKRMVPTTITRITASITAYSAMS